MKGFFILDVRANRAEEGGTLHWKINLIFFQLFYGQPSLLFVSKQMKVLSRKATAHTHKQCDMLRNSLFLYASRKLSLLLSCCSLTINFHILTIAMALNNDIIVIIIIEKTKKRRKKKWKDKLENSLTFHKCELKSWSASRLLLFCMFDPFHHHHSSKFLYSIIW